MRRSASVVVVIITVLLAGASPSTAAPEGSTPKDQPKKGLNYRDLRPGRAGTLCAGAFEAVHPRTGRVIDCTHGPDPIASGRSINAAPAPLSEEEAALAGTIACEAGDDGTSGKRVQAMYVYETDETNRFATYEASFRAWAGEVDQIFFDSAAKTGGERHPRWVHDGNCNLSIIVEGLPNGSLSSFSSMRSELQARGYNSSSRKYSIWADSSAYCGIASLYNDDRDTPLNAHNVNTGHARTDRGCWGGSTEAHELMHNIGGVQASAPHGTGSGYWHCWDEYDLMCYADGGASMQYICLPSSTHNRLFDCNNDDYFHTSPAAGSYLDTHWNTADSSWLFVTPGGGDPPPPPPATPTNLDANATGSSTVSVTWTDNATDETGYELERSGGGGTTTIPLAANATSYADSGLSPGTTYTYRARAVRGVDVSGWSNSDSTTTAQVPPAAPSGAAASASSPSSVSVTWNDNATNETGFTLQRSVNGGGFSALTTVGANVTSYADNSASPDTSYAYRVRADNSAGSSAWSTSNTVTTPAPPPYTDTVASSFSQGAGATQSGSYTDTAADDGSSHVLIESHSGGKPSNRVNAAEGTWTFQVSSAQPAAVIANAWSDVSSDGDSFEFHYSTNGSTWSPLFTVTDTADGGAALTADLPSGTTGTVHVRVRDTDRTRGNTSSDRVFVDHLIVRSYSDPTATIPAAPTNPVANAVAWNQVQLSWTDNADDELGFRIERSGDGGATWAELGSVAADATSYADGSTAGATTYTYRVSAYNGAGSSTPAVSNAVTTPAAPAAIHVEDLAGASSGGPKWWNATVTILIEDAGGVAIANATVTGSWSGAGSDSCVTGAAGTCQITLRTKDNAVTFTATGVSHAGLPYDPSANVETQITIVK